MSLKIEKKIDLTNLSTKILKGILYITLFNRLGDFLVDRKL